MLPIHRNRSVSTKFPVWKFCLRSLWLSLIIKQDHDLLWNSQWSPNVISCKRIFEFLSKPDEQITSAVSATQLLPLLKLKVVVACNGFGDWRSGGLFVLICPQSAFLCAVWQLYLTCSLFQTQPSRPLIVTPCRNSGTPRNDLTGGVPAQTKQPNKLMLTFTASVGSFKKNILTTQTLLSLRLRSLCFIPTPVEQHHTNNYSKNSLGLQKTDMISPLFTASQRNTRF